MSVYIIFQNEVTILFEINFIQKTLSQKNVNIFTSEIQLSSKYDYQSFLQGIIKIILRQVDLYLEKVAPKGRSVSTAVFHKCLQMDSDFKLVFSFHVRTMK